MRSILVLAFCCFGSLLPAQEAITPVRVTLHSGRAFTGRVDARTNETQLWLRTDLAGSSVQRPLAWQQIQAISRDDKPIPVKELQADWPKFASSLPKAKPWLTTPVALLESSVSPKNTVIQAVSAQAALSNHDADAEADGLRIDQSAWNAQGEPTSLHGTLIIELYGYRYGNYSGSSTQTGVRRERLAMWSRQLSGQHDSIFVDFPAELGAFRSLSSYGELHLKWLIPGSGVIERRLYGVRLREYAFFSPLGNL